MTDNRTNFVCSFFGHRTIKDTENLRVRLFNIIEYLITEKNVDKFLFGSRSRFDSLCLELVTILKGKYPHIKRIYVRAEFPFIDENYTRFLHRFYDDTYYPQKLLRAGKAIYVERNLEMIENSEYCVIYYDFHLSQTGKKSGTKIALDLATKKGKKIILV